MSSPSTTLKLKILLADDDKDDCLLFSEALEELQLQTALTLVHNGEQLMQLLTKYSNEVFDVLFLDLNMPRKNGLTCLKEIKQDDKLKALTVIIFSTSYDPRIADLAYESGAQHYISKPADFTQLKNIIQDALLCVTDKNNLHLPIHNFHLRSLKEQLL